ncbi:gephyrin-like molybdotransferase Glp [Kytococcus sedentarius]|uniref:molybdopterin molybdotransferase MoeA n=1 Tax=Kytococcus sedentarius TaxID=1276 RepID=UPI0035BBB74E
MTAQREVLSTEEYTSEVVALVTAPVASEVVDTAAALGRVLAQDARAAGDVPAFANSAMDGYAVRAADLADDLPARLRVVADLPAGSPDDPALAAGECARIMTGAPVPTAADTVVPVELTDAGDHEVLVRELSRGGAGAHVRGAGEDLAAGDLVLPAGTLLDPAALGALAGTGVATVRVRRRPVVGVLATGDELVTGGGPLRRGQIHESNGVLLAAAAREAGADVVTGPPVPDEVDAFTARLDELTASCDLVVLSGGVSVGTYDVARIVLGDAGSGTFRHVRMQPGKPQGHATWRGVPVLAFPGNPLSAAVSWQLFGRAVLAALTGTAAPAWGTAVAGSAWSSPPGRRQLVPVATTTDAAGRLVATPAHQRGSASHMVTALARSDALFAVPQDVTDVRPGDVHPLMRF